MDIRSTEQLIDYINAGNSVKYVFFWGHTREGEHIDKTCFSQWYECKFEIDGHIYPSAEHYMMAEKARLFKDKDIYEKVLKAKSPGEAKKLGREVKGFEQGLWETRRFDIVVDANLAKFSQNPELKEFLLNTNERILVEASPTDKVWGIGLAADNPAVEDPTQWQGQNLLGFALMEARELLMGG